MSSKILTTSFLLSVALSGCGGSDEIQKVSKSNSSDAIASQSLLDRDPTKMSDPELRNYVIQLINRDENEKKELALLQNMNKELCGKLQDVRTSCPGIIRLIPDGTEKVLACDGTYSENIKINNKIEVLGFSAGGGEFNLSSENFTSSSIVNGDQEISFRTIGNKSQRAPRFFDLASLKISRKDKAPMPAMESMQFEIRVNEKPLIDSSALRVANGQNNNLSYRLDLKAIQDLKESDACSVTLKDIQNIRDKIIAEYDGAPPVEEVAAEQTDSTPAENTDPKIDLDKEFE